LCTCQGMQMKCCVSYFLLLLYNCFKGPVRYPHSFFDPL
jgi:hypothetical protein